MVCPAGQTASTALSLVQSCTVHIPPVMGHAGLTADSEFMTACCIIYHPAAHCT